MVKQIVIVCMLLSSALYGRVKPSRMDFYSVKGGASWSELYGTNSDRHRFIFT